MTKAAKPKNKQEEKSEKTRNLTLKATVDCIYDYGYSNTSTKKIADRAKISRGAMVHHFPSKQSLLSAVVDHIIDVRINAYIRDVNLNLKKPSERMDSGLDIYWKHLHTKYFTAHHELLVASRTDAELKPVMRQGIRRFEERWRAMIITTFPEWKDTGALFELAMDVTQFSFEGMALNKLSRDAKRRQKNLVAYIQSRVREMFEAGATGDHDRSVAEFIVRHNTPG
ncbi:MAG: AcrR family transcriptional regulator [Candidatus Azotimanducaceae bacterium]|jgi:AcrR family transcriptional regulator